jgi:hypothetical protein
VDSVLKVRRGLQAPGHDGASGVNGAALVVPGNSVSTIKEAGEVLHDVGSGEIDSKAAGSS